jgi:hypothetical protein
MESKDCEESELFVRQSHNLGPDILLFIFTSGPISNLQPEGQKEPGTPGKRSLRRHRAGKICHHDIRGNGLGRGQNFAYAGTTKYLRFGKFLILVFVLVSVSLFLNFGHGCCMLLHASNLPASTLE